MSDLDDAIQELAERQRIMDEITRQMNRAFWRDILAWLLAAAAFAFDVWLARYGVAAQVAFAPVLAIAVICALRGTE